MKIIEKENEEIELDKKEQIEKYKATCEKEGKEYQEPTNVKSELKLHVSYEGWKKDDKRHSLVNKRYIAGFMTSAELNAQIYQKYNVERILNGDSALWINQLEKALNIFAIKVQEGVIEIENIEEEVQVDNSIEEYMNEVKKAIK